MLRKLRVQVRAAPKRAGRRPHTHCTARQPFCPSERAQCRGLMRARQPPRTAPAESKQRNRFRTAQSTGKTHKARLRTHAHLLKTRTRSRLTCVRPHSLSRRSSSSSRSSCTACGTTRAPSAASLRLFSPSVGDFFFRFAGCFGSAGAQSRPSASAGPDLRIRCDGTVISPRASPSA